MLLQKSARFFLCSAFLGALLSSVSYVVADEGYPNDYKPSKPAEKGETNVLSRLAPLSTYMSDKLTAAGGEKSSMCYRNCLTVGYNDVLKCIEVKITYAASESCEKDAANKMAACDPKCK